jgi:hypothetical protein
MAVRGDRLVYESIENDQHDRCVDLFERSDKTFGFEEFRRDVEDAGVWTPVRYYGYAVYPSRDAAFAAAIKAVGWLAERPGFTTLDDDGRTS